MNFSTQDVHPRERLSYWLEVATRGYVEHEFRPKDANTFTGSVGIATLPGVALATFGCAPAKVCLTQRNTSRCEDGDVLITLHRTGEAAISQDGNDALLVGRSIFIMDPQRPFEINLKTYCKNTVVRVSRAGLEARLGNFAGLAGRAISADSGIATLAMGFIEMLPQQAPHLDEVAGLKVAEQMLDLVALAFMSEETRAPGLSSPRAVALMRLKATVERLLIEPGLKPDRVATETGISVRYANALLAEEHTSIERYIAERRLERCRSALEDVAQSHRSIGEIAFNWGFSDLSHFGRRFKARYGLTPTDYRRQALRIAVSRPTSMATRSFPNLSPERMGLDGAE